MRPTSLLQGASRLPLTGKRGNKDFYKGTGQARVPGGGHRTGPPGKHVVRGTAKYRLVDEKVRVFVAPTQGALGNTELKPYVATQDLDKHERFFNPYSHAYGDRPRLPSFSPNATPMIAGTSLSRRDYTAFSKRWADLSHDERQFVVMQQRRQWWEGMSKKFGSNVADSGAQGTQ
ncbi:hypothetical protein B9479_002369 [Cryptococcus floricola]|uniref:Ribosomal protein L27 n=1 Tax=Cryptococcus floricola TaxID=2591691 RepID=A0A5D3B2E4_9TREE|nr:hypothetical protein B9479_002369 [Cryptococcus floricola]